MIGFVHDTVDSFATRCRNFFRIGANFNGIHHVAMFIFDGNEFVHGSESRLIKGCNQLGADAPNIDPCTLRL
ncbi:hypothetical protein D3C81_1991260 [compost metagenome]